eukprot:14250776-Ditylum_brightwellii.AAC.1
MSLPNANLCNSEHGTPTEYYSHQGQPPDPSILFRSPSTSSIPTEYYSTQRRPPDNPRNQGPQADFPSILLRIFTAKI